VLKLWSDSNLNWRWNWTERMRREASRDYAEKLLLAKKQLEKQRGSLKAELDIVKGEHPRQAALEMFHTKADEMDRMVEEGRERVRTKEQEIIQLEGEKAALVVRIREAEWEAAERRTDKRQSWVDGLAGNAAFMGALDAILALSPAGGANRKRAAEDSEHENVHRQSKKAFV
jgi:hypothetical protein